MRKKTKIICTMGPVTDDREILKKLMQSGMDIARLNFSHGDHEEQKKRIDLIKSVREELGIHIAILLDTKGPEIRTGMVKNNEIVLKEGHDVVLTTEEITGNAERIPITYKNLPKDVHKDTTILIDDGLIELKVTAFGEKDITCRIINGGKVSNHKGINVPGISLQLPPITEKDREDILFGIEQEVDFIAASFVRNADAITEIKDMLAERHADIHVIAKIENEEGVDNLLDIVEASDGIMIARGDLGVEVPEEQIPFLQKSIIKMCNHEFKPVITATQMLDSMIRNPRPTRAEVTDVANAILDGTDAIMLSGETAIGKYPLETLETMVRIAKDTEFHLEYHTIMKHKAGHKGKGITNTIGYATVDTAMSLRAKLIIASSMSGLTAKTISKFRPMTPIMGTSPKEAILRRMQMYWGVIPALTRKVDTTDALLDYVVDTAVNKKLAEEGDLIIITAGIPAGFRGDTNMMKVTRIERG